MDKPKHKQASDTAGVGREESRRKQRESHWSTVDTVILLLVLVAVAGLVFRVIHAYGQRDSETANDFYQIHFEVRDVHPTVLAEVEEFDAVYMKDNGVQLGYVAKQLVDGDTEGKVFHTVGQPTAAGEAPHLVTARGCIISTHGTWSDGSLLIGESGQYLTVGSAVTVRTDRAILTCYITEILPHTSGN